MIEREGVMNQAVGWSRQDAGAALEPPISALTVQAKSGEAEVLTRFRKSVASYARAPSEAHALEVERAVSALRVRRQLVAGLGGPAHERAAHHPPDDAADPHETPFQEREMTEAIKTAPVRRRPKAGGSRAKRRLLDVMISPIPLLAPSRTLVEAARLMRAYHVDGLPVGSDQQLLGMVTASDIVFRAVAESANIGIATVSRMMSHQVVSAAESLPVDEAERLMARHGIRHLPVLNRRKRLVGMVLRDSLLGGTPRRILQRIVFHKHLAGPAGQLRKVAIAAVYVSCSGDSDAMLNVAMDRFAKSEGVSAWTERADGYEIVEA
jgi:CBS domain-containing protein